MARIYSADITAGALKLAESRIIANMLLEGMDESSWKSAITEKNVLQARNVSSAIRIGRLIRDRLAPWDRNLWLMIRDGSAVLAAQAVMAAAIKHSRLLSDFLDLVAREQYRVFATTLKPELWNAYLADCRGRDPEMPEWNETTRRRLRSSVFQILAQSGYLADTRTLRLQRVVLEPRLEAYLEGRREDFVLRCLRVCQ